jgi:hypothetical protein
MGPRQAQAQALVWHTPRTEDTYLLGPKPHRAAHRASFRVFVSSFATTHVLMTLFTATYSTVLCDFHRIPYCAVACP